MTNEIAAYKHAPHSLVTMNAYSQQPKLKPKRTPASSTTCRIGRIFLICAAVFLLINLWVGVQLTTSQRQDNAEKKLLSPMQAMIPVKDAVSSATRNTRSDQHIPQVVVSSKKQEIQFSKNNNKVVVVVGDPQKYHLVFSTSCGTIIDQQHDWQSYLVFFQAMRLDQPGNVTRIVSGCTSVQHEQDVQRSFDSLIKPMSPNFHIHFTPEFARAAAPNSDPQNKHKQRDNDELWKKTKYWNKPFGVKHWMIHQLGYPNSSQHDDEIIMLIDPDMLLQRPLVNDFESSTVDDEFWIQYYQQNPNLRISKVSHGHPMAQAYNFGAAWLKAAIQNLTYVVGSQHSHVHNISIQDARRFYAAGPPYMLTARDMYQVTVHWTDFLPRLFEMHPQFMAEMYAYSLATAHLNLPHQLATGFMVSNVNIDKGEGWYFMNNVPPQQICEKPSPFFSSSSTTTTVPHVLHFCQDYAIGDFFISKYRMPDFLSCDNPLMRMPPTDAALAFHHSRFARTGVQTWDDKTRHGQYRNAFMVCTLYSTLNEAARYYKGRHCRPPHVANYNETWSYFEKR